MVEEWRNIEIEGLYPYQVSNLGRVKALPKVVEYVDGRKRKYSESPIILRPDTKGYFQVQLYNSTRSREYRVHQLVARAFISNPDNKPQVNHKDGNRRNNRVDNLEWCTEKENTLDAIKRGTMYKPAKKISDLEAKAIIQLSEEGVLTQKQIGNKFGLAQAQVSRIVNKNCWT